MKENEEENIFPSWTHTVVLGIVLMGVWFGWSGYFIPLIMAFGVGSVLLTLWISRLLHVVDQEGQPLNFSLVGYVIWLLIEIVKSNIDVLGRILSSNPEAVQPTWVRVPANQKSRLCQVIFANSITLTPGTVSVLLEDGEILVNAICEDGAKALLDGGEMGAKVEKLEQSSKGA